MIGLLAILAPLAPGLPPTPGVPAVPGRPASVVPLSVVSSSEELPHKAVPAGAGSKLVLDVSERADRSPRLKEVDAPVGPGEPFWMRPIYADETPGLARAGPDRTGLLDLLEPHQWRAPLEESGWRIPLEAEESWRNPGSTSLSPELEEVVERLTRPRSCFRVVYRRGGPCLF